MKLWTWAPQDNTELRARFRAPGPHTVARLISSRICNDVRPTGMAVFKQEHTFARRANTVFRISSLNLKYSPRVARPSSAHNFNVFNPSTARMLHLGDPEF